MKNTAKTLTLTAKKAPAKSATAQLAVPKTATSYFLETEAAAKVTVVKTRSRLAAIKAPADEAHAPVGAVEPVQAAPAAEPVEAIEVEQAQAAAPGPVPAPVPAQVPVVVRKRGSKLAALAADESALAAVPVAADEVPAADDVPKAVKTRVARRVEPQATVIQTAGLSLIHI